MEMLGIRPYFGPNEKNDDEESTTTYGKSGIGGGILNALATMILGPIMGPIAMTIGRGVMNKSKGLGFFGGDGDGGSGIGPKVGPTTDYYTGSDEEDKDNEWDPTKPTGDLATSDQQVRIFMVTVTQLQLLRQLLQAYLATSDQQAMIFMGRRPMVKQLQPILDGLMMDTGPQAVE